MMIIMNDRERAKGMLSRLRRWMPPSLVGRSLRKAFSLDG
jgi:hypothetical protein